MGLCGGGGGMAALSTSDSRWEDTRRAKLTSSREADLLGELGREFDLENLPLPRVSMLGEMDCRRSGVELLSPITWLLLLSASSRKFCA